MPQLKNKKTSHRARIGTPTVLFTIPPLCDMECLKKRKDTARYRYKHYFEHTGSFVRITICGSAQTLEKRAAAGNDSIWRVRLTLIKNSKTGRRFWDLKLHPASDGKKPDRVLEIIRKPKDFMERKHMFSTSDMGKVCIHMPPIRYAFPQAA